MSQKVNYEWTLEAIDEFDDISDSEFSEKLSAFADAELNGKDIGLVRNEGTEADGLTDRYWAYIKDGKLPEFFSDDQGREVNIKVPQRFHEELTGSVIYTKLKK